MCYIWWFFGSLLQLLDFPSVSRPDWWSKQWLILFLCLGGNMVFELGNVLPLVSLIFSLKWDPWSRRQHIPVQPKISSSAGSQTQVYMIDMIESEFCQHWRWVFCLCECCSGIQEYYYGNIGCLVPQFWWGKYLQYLKQTTFESVLWNQGSTICVEEQCYHTQDGILWDMSLYHKHILRFFYL